MATHIPPEIERLRYRQGQKLSGRDFRAQAEIEAQLRWWHTRALHDSYGVSAGFEVALIRELKSPPAPASVSVACGMAYDCYGRELMLQTPREFLLPETEPDSPRRGLTLLVRYKEADEYISPRERALVCGPCASTAETVDFVWMDAARAQQSDGVPLCRLSYESAAELGRLAVPRRQLLAAGGGLLRYDAGRGLLVYTGVMSVGTAVELLNLSDEGEFQEAVEKLFELSQHVPSLDPNFVTPRGRPIARPRIGSGHTRPGQTEWEVWAETFTGAKLNKFSAPLGVQVTIDTSAAGFTEEPVYFAWLEVGEQESLGPGVKAGLWSQNNTEFFPVPLAHVASSSITQFRFRLWLPRVIAVIGARAARAANKNFAAEFLNFARRQRLYVCWLGIQCRTRPDWFVGGEEDGHAAR
jgi:hypothetical protein